MGKRMFVFAALTLLIVHSVAEARDDDRGGGRDGDTIRCESSGEKYAYCETQTVGRVEMLKQLSKSPCVQYESWGADSDGSGIWVRNGCRADFLVREERGWRGWRRRGRDRDRDDDRGQASRIRCASKDWSYQQCEVRGRVEDARVARQISKTRCERDDNWGTDRRGIWVDRGCDAEFEVNVR